MRKSTIFISVVLTTFALITLYGVVNAYRSNSNVPSAATEEIVTAVPEPIAEPSLSPMLTPEEAAQLAATVVGQTNLLSAESSNFEGVDAYLITFTNKDVVYVGLDGQILSVQLAPVYVSVAPPAKSNNNGGGGGGESHDDDHEDHEDDDDHDD